MHKLSLDGDSVFGYNLLLPLIWNIVQYNQYLPYKIMNKLKLLCFSFRWKYKVFCDNHISNSMSFLKKTDKREDCIYNSDSEITSSWWSPATFPIVFFFRCFQVAHEYKLEKVNKRMADAQTFWILAGAKKKFQFGGKICSGLIHWHARIVDWNTSKISI